MLRSLARANTGAFNSRRVGRGGQGVTNQNPCAGRMPSLRAPKAWYGLSGRGDSSFRIIEEAGRRARRLLDRFRHCNRRALRPLVCSQSRMLHGQAESCFMRAGVRFVECSREQLVEKYQGKRYLSLPVPFFVALPQFSAAPRGAVGSRGKSQGFVSRCTSSNWIANCSSYRDLENQRFEVWYRQGSRTTMESKMRR